MKKKKSKRLCLLGIFILTLTILTSCFKDKPLSEIEIKNVNSEEFIKLINKESEERNIYIGRETCPSCKDFEKSLKKVKTNKTIFHFDVDKTNDVELKEVKEAISNLELGINSVPALIKLNKDNKFKFQISDDVKDIEKFLNQ